MSGTGIIIDGLTDVQDAFRDVKASLRIAIVKALRRGALIVEGEAKRLCPVDTGRLQGSITSDMVNDHTIAVGTNVEYASYVEYGTRYQSAQPYLRPARDSREQEVREAVGAHIEHALDAIREGVL